MRTCPECKASVEDASKFCENCGYPMADLPASDVPGSTTGTTSPASPGPGAERQPALDNPATPSRPTSWGGTEGSGEVPAGTCSACGFVNLPGEMFCQNCGVQLPPVTSLPPPPPRPSTDLRVEKRELYGTSFLGDLSNYPELGFSAPSGPVPARPPAPPAPVAQPVAVPTSPAVSAGPAGAQLLIREYGKAISIPAGQVEVVIGRSDPVKGVYPEIDLAGHGGESSGVSRRHARLILQDGRWCIEDLNSTNYTFLNRQKLLPGQRYPLRSGDELRLGLLMLEYLEG